MLRMYGYDGGAPLHRPYGGLAAADPAVLGIGGDRVDLTVLPRWTEDGPAPYHLHSADSGAWYDLIWTAPSDRLLLDGRSRAHSSPAERGRADGVLARAGLLPRARDGEDADLLGPAPRAAVAGVVLRRALGRAGVLPMPAVILARERLAAAAPVTLDGLAQGHIRLLGGPERALSVLRRRQKLAVEHDRTTDIYDWDAWGRTAAQTVRGLTLPEVAA
ncbi:hypothetical protein STHAL_32465 [Streptomyces halstedii]|uniref:NERD domain-containing protein n=1 Tax=Streptomyces halstedii TaxID=1944 RepID=A0ABS6U0U3_STRHA|nr:hypothetical protein [Streptomyces halstedii]MBV7674163.1 hypothetical protein [Streptomyces halstedii]